MKRLFTFAAIAAICAAPAFAQNTAPAKNPVPPAAKPGATAPAKSADPKAGKPADTMDPKAMEAAMDAAGKPGPYHKWLENFEGTWETVVKELDPATGKWGEDKGEMTNKLVFGGRFLEMSYKGRNQGKFFYGFGAIGYNNTDKRFEATWYDSMSSGIAMMTGQVDSGQRILTLTGDTTNPLNNQKMTVREVFTLTAKDTYKQEFFMPMNGTDTKMMEITYTRGGKAADAKTETPKTETKPESKTDAKPTDKKPTH